MRDIRSITIDLDDTLWAIRPVIARAECLLKEWLAGNYPRTVPLLTAESMRLIREKVEIEHASRAHDLGHLRREVLRRISRAVGYGVSLADEAFTVFDDARNDVELYPDVLPALESLRENYVIIALTNGNASLEKIGIRNLFDDVVTAANTGSAKPDREIFDSAVRAGGHAAHETLHVGDNPQQDIDGARQAGLKTAWVNRQGHEWPESLPAPDTEVDQIGQLVRILGETRR